MQRPEGLGKETWEIQGEKRRHDMEASVRGSPLCHKVQPGLEWRDVGIMGCRGRGQGATELHPKSIWLFLQIRAGLSAEKQQL